MFCLWVCHILLSIYFLWKIFPMHLYLTILTSHTHSDVHLYLTALTFHTNSDVHNFRTNLFLKIIVINALILNSKISKFNRFCLHISRCRLCLWFFYVIFTNFSCVRTNGSRDLRENYVQGQKKISGSVEISSRLPRWGREEKSNISIQLSLSLLCRAVISDLEVKDSHSSPESRADHSTSLHSTHSSGT